jgi:hypothetical protein
LQNVKGRPRRRWEDNIKLDSKEMSAIARMAEMRNAYVMSENLKGRDSFEE